MSNNIYNILNSFGKVAQEPVVEQKTEKKKTLLESTMESVLADRYTEFKESEENIWAGKDPAELGQADAWYHRKPNPDEYGYAMGTPERKAYLNAYQKMYDEEGPSGGKQYESEETVMEKAPPGMEDLVMKLKKQYPGHEDKAFATAWSIYNKKHSKKESMDEEVAEARGFKKVDGMPAIKKFSAYVQKNIVDLASNASFEAEHKKAPYYNEKLEGYLTKADGTSVTPIFNLGGNLELLGPKKNYLNVPVGMYYTYRGFMMGGVLADKLATVLGYGEKESMEEAGENNPSQLDPESAHAAYYMGKKAYNTFNGNLEIAQVKVRTLPAQYKEIWYRGFQDAAKSSVPNRTQEPQPSGVYKKNEFDIGESKEKPMNAFHPDFLKKQREKEGTGKFDKFDTGYSKRYTKKADKPDYIDLDDDGDTNEPMKKAAKDKKAGEKKGRGRPRKNESLLDSLMNEYNSALTFNESDDLEQDQLRQHIGDDLYSQAVAYVKSGSDNFPPELFDALLDYYSENGEMPYGTATAADGDPYNWLDNKLQELLGNADIDSDDNRPEVDDVDQQPEGDFDQEPIPQESINMNESVRDIAKLAGLLTEATNPWASVRPTGDEDPDVSPLKRPALTPKTAGASDAKSAYKVKTPQGWKFYDDAETADKDAQLYKSQVQFNESEEQLEECGEMMPQPEGEKKDAFTVTATYNGAEGTQTINVNADGETANQIAQILKLSGLMGGKQEQVYQPVQVQVAAEPQQEEAIEEDSRYEASTTPDEHYYPTDTLTKGGDGEVAGKEKAMNKHGAARFSDNPLATESSDPFERLGEELMAEYESIKQQYK